MCYIIATSFLNCLITNRMLLIAFTKLLLSLQALRLSESILFFIFQNEQDMAPGRFSNVFKFQFELNNMVSHSH